MTSNRLSIPHMLPPLIQQRPKGKCSVMAYNTNTRIFSRIFSYTSAISPIPMTIVCLLHTLFSDSCLISFMFFCCLSAGNFLVSSCSYTFRHHRVSFSSPFSPIFVCLFVSPISYSLCRFRFHPSPQLAVLYYSISSRFRTGDVKHPIYSMYIMTDIRTCFTTFFMMTI